MQSIMKYGDREHDTSSLKINHWNICTNLTKPRGAKKKKNEEETTKSEQRQKKSWAYTTQPIKKKNAKGNHIQSQKNRSATKRGQRTRRVSNAQINHNDKPFKSYHIQEENTKRERAITITRQYKEKKTTTTTYLWWSNNPTQLTKVINHCSKPCRGKQRKQHNIHILTNTTDPNTKKTTNDQQKKRLPKPTQETQSNHQQQRGLGRVRISRLANHPLQKSWWRCSEERAQPSRQCIKAS